MMYLVHIAAFLGLSIIAAGIASLHFAARERSGPLRGTAWVLLVGGTLGLGCIVYYSLKYWQDGYFETPMPAMACNMTGNACAPTHTMQH